MNVNCGNIGKEEESLNIRNVNLLNSFKKTGEIFSGYKLCGDVSSLQQ